MAHIIFSGSREDAIKKYPNKLVLEDGGQIHIFDTSKEYDEYRGVNNAHFKNGAAKARVAIANMLGIHYSNLRPMTIAEIIKGAKEGRWEPQVDVEGKRPGQHVWVKMGGKDVNIEVKA